MCLVAGRDWTRAPRETSRLGTRQASGGCHRSQASAPSGAGQRDEACPERRCYRERRTAPTMSSARHVASRTGPTISTTQRVTVSEDGEPLTQLFHVSLPAVKAITVAMTRARRAPPESVVATRKGQRGPPPAVRRPSTDAPRTTRNEAAMMSISRLLDIPRLCISHQISCSDYVSARRSVQWFGPARPLIGMGVLRVGASTSRRRDDRTSPFPTRRAA
jgi:hypothetical protein